jgi:hypothetical protein
MVVASVKLQNIKVFEDLELLLNGQDVALVADSEGGKSTVMDTIKASLGIDDYPKDALRRGKEEGGSEVKLIDPATGISWIFRRRYSRGNLQRFEVTTSDGVPLKWKDVIKDLFNGIDPKVSYFDWGAFFYEEKTPVGRFKYAMKCVLGLSYTEISEKIDILEDERGDLGTEKGKLKVRLEGSEITDENYLQLKKLYEKPKDNQVAQELRVALLEKRPKIPVILDKLAAVKKANEAHKKKHQEWLELTEDYIPRLQRNLKNISAVIQAIDLTIPLENQVAFQKFERLELSEEIGQIQSDFFDYMYRILERRQKLIEEFQAVGSLIVSNERLATELLAELNNLELDTELQATLQQSLADAEVFAKRIEDDAQEKYDQMIQENEKFNLKRQTFIIHEVDYLKLQTISQSWIDKDNAIKDLRTQCVRAFKEKIPFENMEIRDIVSATKKNGVLVEKVEQHLYYDGRELNRQNVSTGLSLKIAIQFQMIHNPRFRTIFIPDAKALGSKFYEVIEAAKELNFQWIAELTEISDNFQIKFSEEILKDKRTAAKKKK